MAKYVEQEEKTGNTEILNRRANENEIDMIENNVNYAGDNSCETRATQQQKCGQSTPITNLTPSKIRQFSIYDMNKRRYEENCKSFTVAMERRIELAA